MLYEPLSSSTQSLQALGPDVPTDSFLAHIQVGGCPGHSEFLWHRHVLVPEHIRLGDVFYHTIMSGDRRCSRSPTDCWPAASASTAISGLAAGKRGRMLVAECREALLPRHLSMKPAKRS